MHNHSSIDHRHLDAHGRAREEIRGGIFTGRWYWAYYDYQSGVHVGECCREHRDTGHESPEAARECHRRWRFATHTTVGPRPAYMPAKNCEFPGCTKLATHKAHPPGMNMFELCEEHCHHAVTEKLSPADPALPRERLAFMTMEAGHGA